MAPTTDSATRASSARRRRTADRFQAAVAPASAGIGGAGLALLAGVVVAVPLVLGSVALLVRRHAPDGSFVHFATWVGRASRQPGSPASLRLAQRLFLLTRRDVFALVLMLASFAGSRALLACLVAFGVALAAYVLLFHRRRLVACTHLAD